MAWMDRNNKTAWEGIVLIVLGLLSIILIESCSRAREAEAHSGHDHIPPAAEQYRRTLIREVRYYMGLHEPMSRFAAQVHQESNWRSGVCSKYACGLSQFTEGTAKDMARIYPKDLEGRAAPLDPHWALRAMVLYMKQLRNASLAFGDEAHAVALVKYNGGAGWVAREARKAAAAGNDPTQWVGHVERHCLRAQWACEESRNYPRKILERWWPMFQKAGW